MRSFLPLVPVALVLILSACGSGSADSEPAAAASPATDEVADLVVRGGRILTVDPERPEVEALAARDGRIVALGTDAEIEPWIGETTRVVEIGDGVAIPGFIEGHGHFLDYGMLLSNLDLRDARSWDEIVARVEAAAAEAEPGAWISGRGWHQDKWDELPERTVEGVPTHHALSAVSPDNPVYLEHASGHGGLVNAVTMEKFGIDASTQDPPGGTILRDADGEPTGYLRETADDAIETASNATVDLERAASLAAAASLRHGVTSFQNASATLEELEVIRRSVADGALGIRIWSMIREEPERARGALPAIAEVRDGEDGWFRFGGLKHSIDGALGSHGAWLLEPYEDLPSTSGLNTKPIPTIEESARVAIEHDLQLCVHAIGDRANREVLDLYERIAEEEEVDISSLRWRIEHAQHLHPDDVPRFAELGVIAAIQAIHCVSDGPWVPTRIGEERAREGAYVWRDLLEAGARLVNGTDVPVEPIDPIANFYASVTRRTGTGDAFHPDQALTREEALRSMTLDAAYAAFEEEEKGSLEVGKLADLTILSRDLLSVSDDEILETEVLATIVGGEVRWQSGDAE